MRARYKFLPFLVAVIALAAAPAACASAVFIEDHAERLHGNALDAGRDHLCIRRTVLTFENSSGNRGEP